MKKQFLLTITLLFNSSHGLASPETNQEIIYVEKTSEVYYTSPSAQTAHIKAEQKVSGSVFEDLTHLLNESAATQERVREIASNISNKFKGAYALIPSIKSFKRAMEKAAADYDGQVKLLTDLARGSLVFRSLEDLYEGVRLFSESYKIVKIKDRFLEPLHSGYRDVNIVFQDPFNEHIGELQFHLEHIIHAKEKMHKLYEIERTIEADTKIFSTPLTKEQNFTIYFLQKISALYYTTALKNGIKDGFRLDSGVKTTLMSW